MNVKKELLIGFLIGLASNLIGIYLYVFFFIDMAFEPAIEVAMKNDSLGSIIGLGALLNLAPFFLLLKKNQLLRARGVLLATIIAAISILLTKVF
ncbi:MAG TPA: hypothetical protein VFD80_05140 [Flavobacteriaceae bacterium]|nr:hypothetical protein [Flavobacteriaceae bacterium]